MEGSLELATHPLAPPLLGTLLGLLAGYGLAAARRRRRAASLKGEVEGLARRTRQLEGRLSSLRERHEHTEAEAAGLRRALVQIPDLAQRVASPGEPKAVPPRVLELVEEVFAPSYAVFYRSRGEELVAVAKRGSSGISLGHRMAVGEGVVGWTAFRQVLYTAEDAEHETPTTKRERLATSWPPDFSFCLPLTIEERSLGVVLVGPCREQPHARELGRAVALLASVAMHGASLLREQRLLAERDGLTGLVNRKNIVERVRDLVRASLDQRRPVAVFLFDVDHFKHYNDTNGHLAGDELLRALSALLREKLREDEYIGRYGGEEFLLAMPATDKKGALRAAERVRRLVEVEAFPEATSQPGGRLTLSGGVASAPEDGRDVTTLIQRADEALYESKRQGRNRVTAYEPPPLLGGDPFGSALEEANDDEETARELSPKLAGP